MNSLEKIVTQEKVSEIAETLMEQGERPTNRMIYQKLGGGSMTTIAACLRTWKLSKLNEKEAEALPELPDSIQERILKTTQEIWKMAQSQAEALFKEKEATQKAQLEEYEKNREEWAEELQSTLEELAELQKRAQEMTEKATLEEKARLDAENQLETLNREKALMNQKIDSLTEQLHQKQEECLEKTSRLEEQSRDFQIERTRSENLFEHLRSTLEKERDTATAWAKEAEQRLKESETEKNHFKKHAGHLERDIEKKEQARLFLAEKETEMTQRIEKMKLENSLLQQQNGQLLIQLGQLNTLLYQQLQQKTQEGEDKSAQQTNG